MVNKYKNIIFDFGGVIGPRSNGWKSIHKNVSSIAGLSPDELKSIAHDFWPRLETGKSNVEEFWSEVVRRSPNDITLDKLETAYEKNFTADKEVLAIAKKLKSKGFKMLILSNASKKWLDFKIQKFKLKTIFEQIYNSAEIGLIKPDLDIYKFVLEKENINPNETIFIDDLAENIKAANALGISGIVYKNPDRLKEDLESLLNISL